MKHWIVGAVLALLAALVPLSDSPPAQAQGPRSIRILHLVPPGIEPRFDDMDVRIPATMDAIQDFLQQDVGRTLRITPGVTRVSVNNDSTLFMQDQLILQGFDDVDTIYLIFAEAFGDGTVCGQTLPRFGDEPSYSFLLMPVCNGGIYPAPAADALWPYDATFLTLHELLHAMGAVPTCAPNYTSRGGGHVDDSPLDILYVGARTLDDFLNVTVDVNRDDYYGHNNRSCPDLIASPYWATAAPPGKYCRGSRVTIDMTRGASGAGTPGDDVIFGTSGNDIIDGGGGDDVICAGRGDDTVDGGPGNDRIFGAQGLDNLSGGHGDDIIHGNLGADLIDGGPGDDRLFGYADNDTIFGGTGDDRLHGNVGNDELRGGQGNDRLFGYGGDDDISGGPGDDVIRGNWGHDVLDGKDGRDKIFGAGGQDILLGGPGDDLLEGNSGDDLLEGGDGFDTLDGGVGSDACDGGRQSDLASRCELEMSIP